MDFRKISEKPETLDSLFAQLDESMFRYKKEAVLTYLFDYASRVLDHEGIQTGDNGAEDFREFVMRNEMKDVVDEFLNAGQKMKHPENCWISIDIQRSWANYDADPRKCYIYEIFQKSGFSRDKSRIPEPKS